MLKLLVTFNDGSTMITKFNGKLKEAMAVYQKENAKTKYPPAKTKSITILPKNKTFKVSA